MTISIYHDITVRLVSIGGDIVTVSDGYKNGWFKRSDMSYASWYVLRDAVPGTEVLIKVRRELY